MTESSDLCSFTVPKKLQYCSWVNRHCSVLELVHFSVCCLVRDAWPLLGMSDWTRKNHILYYKISMMFFFLLKLIQFSQFLCISPHSTFCVASPSWDTTSRHQSCLIFVQCFEKCSRSVSHLCSQTSEKLKGLVFSHFKEKGTKRVRVYWKLWPQILGLFSPMYRHWIPFLKQAC